MANCSARTRPIEAFHEQFQRLTSPRPGHVSEASREPTRRETLAPPESRFVQVGRSVFGEENATQGKKGDPGTSGVQEACDEEELRRAVEKGEPYRGAEGGEPSVLSEPVVWCDPLARSLLQWAPPPVALAPAASVPDVVLEHIAGQLVKRVAVGTSAVQLQLGKGQLDGAELLVRATADGLEIRLTAPPGVNGRQLGIAIADRLARRGLRVANIEVE